MKDVDGTRLDYLSQPLTFEPARCCKQTQVERVIAPFVYLRRPLIREAFELFGRDQHYVSVTQRK